MPTVGYRPDIEGLRAIAVLVVVLFHLDVPGFSGGFVGVDVFFVISGFLIGGIVVRERQRGVFAFGDYLARRIRRIVPLMLAVLLAVSVAAFLLLLPGELEAFAKSLIASLTFTANVHFWQTSQLYGLSAEVPLLHMWSLGVEGQFYLLLPLLILPLYRIGRTGLWLGLVALAGLSALVSLSFPQASFYLLPARLWEFVLGLMVAITPLPFVSRRWAREGLALTGLCLIAIAVLGFTSQTPFSGWRVALPCLGTAAIIAAGNGGSSSIGRVLSTALFTFIGKISYSLYLWHWPIIVLLLLSLPASELSWTMRLFVVVLSLALSVLSWRFVEEPFRKQSVPFRKLGTVSAALAASLVLAASLITMSKGWPERYDERTLVLAGALDYPINDVFRSGTCFVYHPSITFDRERCLVGQEGQPKVLLIGDSYAAHLWPGLSRNFAASSIVQVTAAGCRPLIDPPPSAYPFCDELTSWAYSEYLREQDVDLVVLAANWKPVDLGPLKATLRQLSAEGHEVLLVGPMPSWDLFVPRLLALGYARGEPRLPDRFFDDDRRILDREMASLAERNKVRYFSIMGALCDPHCRYLDDAGQPMIVDNSHLTMEASVLMTGDIEHPALVRVP